MSYRNNSLKGVLQVPGDKSISHRALIFATLAKGTSLIYDLSPALDCASSIGCLRQLGIAIKPPGTESSGAQRLAWSVESKGVGELICPPAPLFCGNSGTTMRLLSGLLAGCEFRTIFDGDASLRRRPMGRLLRLLAQMGTDIDYLEQDNCAPFAISGKNLEGAEFKLEIASAQVQTALVLAGLGAAGKTSITVPHAVRDHTEKMLRYIAVPFSKPDPNTIAVSKLTEPVSPYTITVPGDISSAAFFMVAAACIPGSELILTNLVLNKGRTLVIEILELMGAQITVLNQHEACGELVGDVSVRYCERLRGATVDGGKLAAGIDEIPILALAGALCDGTFSVKDAAELRIKESDRIAAVVSNLRAQGVNIEEFPDGFSIYGQPTLTGGAEWKSFGDHRIAMSGVIADLVAENQVKVDDLSCIDVSYPRFLADLAGLRLA